MQVAFRVPAKAGWCLICIFQNLQRRQPSRRAHNPPSWMGSRSAHVQILNRSTKARPARDRAQKEKLFQRQLTLKNISFAQSPFTFEIKRSDHLLVQND